MTHQFAEAAANAAECAGQQGRFAEFANETFNHQSRIGRTPWVEFAAKSGVADTMAFNKCVTDRAFSQLIDRDVAAGDSLEIVGTPTMVINGTIVTGALTVSQLERRISEAMKRTEVAER
jgi:protein-disulfide isomerase